ncbi:MAG: trypsin-like peptidase domain-containing protein [Prevotellaceae bacterium]|nr:trypsin-like peptidase domain-containing protein [Prevotellaceae bacterium]
MVKMPLVNADSLLLADRAETDINKPFRFGYAIDVDMGFQNSGTWEILNNGDKIWRLKIHSEKAFSINLIYDKFWLPEGSQFFVYNEDKSMVLGAFTADVSNNKQNVFATDLIQGNTIVLEYYEPCDVKGGIINIDKIIHGYVNTFSSGLGSSANCNIDVNCSPGNGWDNEKNAVSMILVDDNTAFCSGCLINNVEQDFTPYYLTANHCLSGNTATWIFRFKYWKPTCNGSNPTGWKSIVGATLRANHAATDFALLELSTIPPADFGLFYAGWDRTTFPATSATGIHHPRGDAMKISHDSDALTSVSWGTVTTNHWRAIFEQGIVQHGSSGSPLFNQNHRIVGQLHGNYNNGCGTTNNTCHCSQTPIGEYGKFDVSWEGGGTDDTRLSNWLDPNETNPPMLDGLFIPTISGPDYLYSFQQTTYTINNLPSGTTVTWSISSNASIISGQGTSQVTISICSGETATLTATLSGTVNNTLTKTLVVNAGELQITIGGDYSQVDFEYPNAQCYDWDLGSNLSSGTGSGTINCTNYASLTVTPLNGAENGDIAVRARLNNCYSPWQTDNVIFWHPEIDGACSYLNPMSGEPFSACLTEPFPDNGKTGQVEYHWYIGSTFIDITSEPYVQSWNWPCGESHVSVIIYIDNQATEMSASADFWGMCSGGGWSAAYPNPASNELIIDKIESDEALVTTSTKSVNVKSSETTILLYSHATTKLAYKKTYPSSAKQIKIDTSTLPNGVYYLNIIENGETTKQQTIVVNH